MFAWHFTNGMKLRDGTPLEVGRTYTIEGEPVLCKHGFHASRRIIDALFYCRGTHLCFVWCDGKIVEGVDKLVCQRRTVLAIVEVGDMFDAATAVLKLSCEKAARRALLKYRKKQASLKRLEGTLGSELCAIQRRVAKAWEKSVTSLVMARILGT